MIRKSSIDTPFWKKGEWYTLAPSIKSLKIMQDFVTQQFHPEPISQKGQWKCVHDVFGMYNGKTLDALVFETL